eukprot:5409987-Amphidinium_carterae.1
MLMMTMTMMMTMRMRKQNKDVDNLQVVDLEFYQYKAVEGPPRPFHLPEKQWDRSALQVRQTAPVSKCILVPYLSGDKDPPPQKRPGAR